MGFKKTRAISRKIYDIVGKDNRLQVCITLQRKTPNITCMKLQDRKGLSRYSK
jgi:hypothetical protein